MFGWKSQTQAGFTLIELMLVLAIIGALAAIAFSGQNEIRSRVRFSLAVDNVVSSLSKAQNEANTTVNLNQNNRGTGGASKTTVSFANVVMFSNNSPQFKITPMDFPDTPETCTLPCTMTLHDTAPDDESYSVDLGQVNVVLANPSQYVVFARDPDTSQSVTYTPPGSWGTNELTAFANYTNLPTTAQIGLDDGNGHQACVTVEAPSGNITRSFNPCS